VQAARIKLLWEHVARRTRMIQAGKSCVHVAHTNTELGVHRDQLGVILDEYAEEEADSAR